MLTYLGQEKVFSCKLAEEPVQIAIEGFNVFVLTNPYPVEIMDNEENEEALAINMLAARKTGITLWKLAVGENDINISNKRNNTGCNTWKNNICLRSHLKKAFMCWI